MKTVFKEQLSQEDKQRWLNFWLESAHAHPRQHFLLGALEVARGRTPLYAMAEDEGKLAGVAVLALHPLLPGLRCSSEAFCFRGPAFDSPEVGREFLVQIISKLSHLGVGTVRISPDWIYPDASAVEAMLADLGFKPTDPSPRSGTGFVDLRRDEDKILASFSKSTRTQIRLTERNGVEVRALVTGDEIRMAYECIALHHRRMGLGRIPRRELEATFESVYKPGDLGVMFGAFNDNRLLGVIAAIRSTHTAHPSIYSLNAELARELTNVSIGPSLWWRVARWAKERGCARLDVEGNVTVVDPKHPIYEVSNFKRRFSPTPVERLGEFDQVCHPALRAIHILGHKISSAWKHGVGLIFSLRTEGRRGSSATRDAAPPSTGTS